MSVDHMEIEWQFDTTDLDMVQRWLEANASSHGVSVRPAEVRQQRDTYFDSVDWRVFNAGYALRVRRLTGHAEATLKSLVPAGQGARHRREISEELADDQVPPATVITASPPVITALELLHRATGEVGRRVNALSGTRRVRRLFELQTERHVYEILIGGKPAGEIALDETHIVAQPRGKEARLRRVEVEVYDDSAVELRTFVEALHKACDLRRSITTKFEAGLMAQRLVPDPPPHFGPTKVSRKSSSGDVALAVLRKQFAAFLIREPGVRLNEDVEEVHQMRLAARRMRAALRLFSRTLPSAIMELTNDVKWIGGLLGQVRDLDVQLDWLSSDAMRQSVMEKGHPGGIDLTIPSSSITTLRQDGPGSADPYGEPAGDTQVVPAQIRSDGVLDSILNTAPKTDQETAPVPATIIPAELDNPLQTDDGLGAVRALLEAKRKEAHQRLIQALDTPRYERFKAHFSTLLRHPPKAPDRAKQLERSLAPRLFLSYYRKARKYGDKVGMNATVAEYHTLRIKLKSVRHCLEFIEDLYGKPARLMLKRVEELGDTLGVYHDMQVAIQQFRDWQYNSTPELPANALAILDALIRCTVAHSDELKAQFPELYARIRGKDWRRLHRVMKTH